MISDFKSWFSNGYWNTGFFSDFWIWIGFFRTLEKDKYLYQSTSDTNIPGVTAPRKSITAKLLVFGIYRPYRKYTRCVHVAKELTLVKETGYFLLIAD